MNRSKRLWIGLAVLVVVASAWMLWKRGAEAQPKYRTAAAEVGRIETVVSATGTINPVEQVEIGSQVSGTVLRLNADYNSRVHKGQILLQLDASAIQARVAQAEASVAKAQASVRESEQNLARAKALLPQKYIAQAEVDIITSTLRQRQADQKQAAAQLRAARVDLANTTIRSPIDGVVIARSIDLGQTVAASLAAPKLFVIANDLTHMQVETKIDEADIGRIRPGLKVEFTVDAFPDETFDGTVSQIRLEPIVEQNVVTYTTVISTANPQLRLRPGMTANVSVQVAAKDEVLKVPNSALRFRPPADTQDAARSTERGERAGGGAGASASRTVAASDGTGGVERARDGSGRGTGGERGQWRGRGGRRDSTGAVAGRGDGSGRRGGGRNRGGQGATTAGADTSALPQSGPVVMGTIEDPGMKPGSVYVLRAGKPVRIRVETGITDGGSTEVRSDDLQPGDQVIIGLEAAKTANNQELQPPPGMGGRRGGGGRGR